MLVRALLSRGFLVNAAIIVVCGLGWCYALYEMQTKLESLESPTDYISLTQDKLDEITFEDRHVVAVKDFKFLGASFTDRGYSYQLLSAKNNEAELESDSLILAQSHNLDGEALRATIANSKGGRWYSAIDSDLETSQDSDLELSQDSAEAAWVHPDYPELDLTGLNRIAFLDLQAMSKFIYIYWGILAAHVLSIFFTLYYQVRTMQKREAWEVKLQNFNPEMLGQYSHAMRLCGTETSGLLNRRVDPNFDVTQKSKSKRPKLKQWGWKIGAILAVSVIGGVLQFGTTYGLRDLLDNRWAQMGVGLLFMIGIQVALFKAQGVRVGGLLEEPIKPGSRWAKYQTLPFFKYHDHVLKSLGMIELGAFKQTGGHVCMVRTIYISPNGNVLVEVGIEGKEFFTIESVINSGKFLETHSMAKPGQIKANLLQRHQRRSASHEDILQALEDHDQFVREFAGTGFCEAQFDAEKYPRFLEWGGENNAT